LIKNKYPRSTLCCIRWKNN